MMRTVGRAARHTPARGTQVKRVRRNRVVVLFLPETERVERETGKRSFAKDMMGEWFSKRAEIAMLNPSVQLRMLVCLGLIQPFQGCLELSAPSLQGSSCLATLG